MKGHEEVLRDLEERLSSAVVVTVEAHDDPVLWSRMMELVYRHGFALAPGTFKTSSVTLIEGRPVWSHTADFLRLPRELLGNAVPERVIIPTKSAGGMYQ